MNHDKLESVLGLSCEERYDYFLSEVGQLREIWILVNSDNQFLKIYAEEEGFEYLPVWPHSDFALNYCKNSSDLLPKNISMPEFFKKWIAGLNRDGLEIGVIPSFDASVWIMTPSELKKDLQDEMSNI